ncbi:hypothetical protein CRE_29361 [Caenorhabditis remanei]|uniref:Uncharacterized protein n=1 Tax=Caenorhabditis remanei TaxID=31234 RepID=E3MY26_CAERE|nr:hypothetical protein CRE_29361 [Caenorhabditis remanei]
MIYLPPPTISTTPSPPLLDIDKELSMISSICLPREEYETLTGDVVKGRSAFYFNLDLLQNSQQVIGFQELRAAIGTPLSIEWKKSEKGIKFLDKRVPAVRSFYRQRFEKVRRRPDAKLIVHGVEIDYNIILIHIMYAKYDELKPAFDRAISRMLENTKCWEVDQKKHKKNRKYEKLRRINFRNPVK